jgi:hypothetical protein
MLRMTLELLPYGSEKDKKTLKIVEIANSMTHADPWKFGNYKARFKDKLHSDREWKFKYITDFPRSQYDAVYLLYLVLRKYLHEIQEPIDDWAKRDKDASGGPGHSLLPGVSSGVGKYGKRDNSKSGSPKFYHKRLRKFHNEAVSLWEQQLQKEDIPGVQIKQTETGKTTMS